MWARVTPGPHSRAGNPRSREALGCRLAHIQWQRVRGLDGAEAANRVIYSASDLAAAARCEYALLRSFDAQLGWGPPVAVEDELLARTAKLGGEHEQRHLDELRELADDSVAIIGRPPYTVAGLTAAAEQTMRAVERRAPVIYQAAMFDGRFVGFADFLVFDGLSAVPAARHEAGPLGQGRGAAPARGLRRHARRGGCTRRS